jgi:ribonuclease VapC
MREFGLERAQETLARIKEYRIDIVEIDQDLALAAAYLKSLHPISYADCFAAALAQQLDAAVVTGDPDFQQLEGRVAIEWLPADET